MHNHNNRLVITPGEPAGVGPDLAITLAQQDWPVELVVCADPALLLARASQLNLPLQLREYQADQPAIAQQAGSLTILPVKQLLMLSLASLMSVTVTMWLKR